METDVKKESKKGYEISAYIFVGCMFLGMGLGMIFNARSIGTYIGMGVGFLIGAITKMQFSKKS